MKDFNKLEQDLGISFKNKDLLKQAFCHRSYLNEEPDFYLKNNERLEFLGDAVLELAVTEHLFANYDNAEGELTSWRAALVNSLSLSKISQKLDFDSYLLLSKGEEKDTGKARQFILANTFESFIGALFLDQGYDEAKKFINSHLIPELPMILEKGIWKDAKSKFQEASQEKAKLTPSYKVLEESGPDHEKKFVTGVYLGNKLIAKGQGLSKQESEEKAAQKALEKKNW